MCHMITHMTWFIRCVSNRKNTACWEHNVQTTQPSFSRTEQKVISQNTQTSPFSVSCIRLNNTNMHLKIQMQCNDHIIKKKNIITFIYYNTQCIHCISWPIYRCDNLPNIYPQSQILWNWIDNIFRLDFLITLRGFAFKILQ